MLRKIAFCAFAAAFSAASAVVVDFNHAIARSYADHNAVTFMADEKDTSSFHQLLMATGKNFRREETVACSIKEETIHEDEVTVLLAIDKCLNASSLAMIHSWVEKLQSETLMYFSESTKCKIRFDTLPVPGACQEFSEKNLNGLKTVFDDSWKESEVSLLATAVQAADVARLSSFSKFGRVLEVAPEVTNTPIAVVGFTNNEFAYKEIEQYERMYKIDKAFNFQICDKGRSCEGRFQNCIFLQECVDLFMYNPFTVVREFYCEHLSGGVPVSYVDSNNVRQCFCSCPVGYSIRGDGREKFCEPDDPPTCPCVWSNYHYGYKHKVEEELKECKFDQIATKWEVDVPFPSDNYVADQRVNDHDVEGNLLDGPHVDLSTAKLHSTVYPWKPFSGAPGVEHLDKWEEFVAQFDEGLRTTAAVLIPVVSEDGKATKTYTWRQYQNERQAAVDKLTYTSYGKYSLDLYAKDYTKDATCHGCVAIVDHYRPQHTTQCPAHFCDNTTSKCDGAEAATAELTKTNLLAADALVDQFYDFQEKAKNDACSEENRCDEEHFAIKDFFQTSYCDREYSTGKQCFDPESVRKAFLSKSKAKKNPLVCSDGSPEQDETPVEPGQCTRCCDLATKLRERWTDYTCGYDYDFERCEGLEDEKCGFKQCLQLNGDSIATVSARIKENVAADSAKLLEKIVQKGFQTYTQIHRALECSKFGGTDGVCKFSAKLSELIEVQTRANYDLGGLADIDDIVFWRYKVEGGAWKLLGHGAALDTLVFDKDETRITIEAWTQCGRVRKFYFYVHLHLNTEVKVCEQFDEMFYQTSVNRLPVAQDLCAYPGSEFAELTFDYHPNAGLQYGRNKVRMDVTKVVCKINHKGRSADELFELTKKSPEIVQRFAVELANNPETAKETKFDITCEFTYTKYDGGEVTQPCSKCFTIKDCDGPKIDKPKGQCEFDTCAGSELPGPYEACGGIVVKSTASASIVQKQQQECCQACDTPTTCVPILGLPNEAEDIKRCEPGHEDEGGYGDIMPPPPPPEDIYQNLRTPLKENFCLDVNGGNENGAKLVMNTCNDANTFSQLFFLDAENRLVIKSSNKCVDVTGGGTADRTEVIQWDCHNNNNQKWDWDEEGRLHARHAPNMCLDIYGSGKNDGVKIIIYGCHGHSNQKWFFAAPNPATVAFLMSSSTSLVSMTQNHSTLMALAGSSALMALVALVVVKRRRAAKAEAVDDAYYPLLH